MDLDLYEEIAASSRKLKDLLESRAELEAVIACGEAAAVKLSAVNAEIVAIQEYRTALEARKRK